MGYIDSGSVKPLIRIIRAVIFIVLIFLVPVSLWKYTLLEKKKLVETKARIVIVIVYS